MRFRSSMARQGACALVAACWLGLAPAAVAQDEGDGATQAEVSAALETLKADPNLSQETTTRSLRWDSDNSPRKRTGFGNWLAGFFGWIGQLSRAVIWIACGILAVVLIRFLYRLLKRIDAERVDKPDLIPTHVRDLDIRPESLPDDIGAAALELWQRNEHRAALALLYRGLLSRLAHVHAVPIRDSTTEGDCLELAGQHLESESTAYVVRLVRLWQHATYGGREPQSDDVRALCGEFAHALAPGARRP